MDNRPGERTYSSTEVRDALTKSYASEDLIHRVFNHLAVTPVEPAFTTVEQPVIAKTSRGIAVLYYLGGLLVVSAMTVFLGTSWYEGGSAIALTVLVVYAAVFAGLASFFKSRGLEIPAGLMATALAATTPGIVFATLDSVGVDQDTDLFSSSLSAYLQSPWAWMEMMTIFVALAVKRWINYSAILAVLGTALYLMATNVAWIIVRRDANNVSDSQEALLALLLGLVGIAIAIAYDAKRARRHAFWAHLIGLSSVMGAVGWAMLEADAVVAALLAGFVGALFVAFGTLVARKLYYAVGGVLVFASAAWFAFDIFDGSLLVAPAIAMIGIGVIVGGVVLQRSATTLRAETAGSFPAWIQRLSQDEESEPVAQHA